MTYREAVRETAGQLRAAGIENETAESLFLLEFACGMERKDYLLSQMEEMPPEQWERYRAAAAKRCGHIPLQHLTGEQEFMGLPFTVNRHVLIPRQDTEVLVEEALKILRSGWPQEQELQPDGQASGEAAQEKLRVLDLCTGSGCIAVSLKALCPQIQVSAADLSADALSVARENAQRNHTEIHFVQSDLFADISGCFQMIVSNPPYIPSREIPALMPEVREHEPLLALDGGADGLGFYRRIIAEGVGHLESGGWLLFEIGYDQGEAVSACMRAYDFTEIEVVRDLAGLDRVVKGRRK